MPLTRHPIGCDAVKIRISASAESRGGRGKTSTSFVTSSWRRWGKGCQWWRQLGPAGRSGASSEKQARIPETKPWWAGVQEQEQEQEGAGKVGRSARPPECAGTELNDYAKSGANGKWSSNVERDMHSAFSRWNHNALANYTIKLTLKPRQT